jgi:hypothetical protein
MSFQHAVSVDEQELVDSSPVHRSLIFGMFTVGCLGIIGAAVGFYITLRHATDPSFIKYLRIAIYPIGLALSVMLLARAFSFWVHYRRYVGSALATGRSLFEIVRIYEARKIIVDQIQDGKEPYRIALEQFEWVQTYRARLYSIGATRAARQLDEDVEKSIVIVRDIVT